VKRERRRAVVQSGRAPAPLQRRPASSSVASSVVEAPTQSVCDVGLFRFVSELREPGTDCAESKQKCFWQAAALVDSPSRQRVARKVALRGVHKGGSAMGPQRRVPRQLANLRGMCLVEEELATVGWRECWILDISTLGMGITFRHRRVSELTGRSISVEVPSASDSARVRLEGKIKNAQLIQPGVVRVGIEFVGTSTAEQALATVLSALTEMNPSDTMLVLRMDQRT